MSVWLLALDIFFDVSFVYNSVYDFVCGITILRFREHGLAQLHSNVFTNTRLDPFVKRIMAYWILTYSFPRLLAGFYSNPMLDASCGVTYIVEGVSYHMEQNYFKSTNEKATFVAYTSYALGIFAIARSFYQWAPVNNGLDFTLLNYRIGHWQSIVAAILSGIAWSYGIYHATTNAMRQTQHASSYVKKEGRIKKHNEESFLV